MGSFRTEKDAGFILVTVLLMIVILSLIGITNMITSSNEVLIAGYVNKSKEAFYVSEAALEEVKYFVLNDPMKSTSTAVGPGTLQDDTQNWATDEYAGMYLVDNAASEMLISGNSFDTLNVSGTPLAGSYHIVFKVYDSGTSGINGAGSANTFNVPGMAWATDEWFNHILVDSAGSEFTIVSNTADTLTVAGTPVSGDWSIFGNIGGSDVMTVVNGYSPLPSYINSYQVGWVLIDSNNNKFNVDDVSGFIGNDINLEAGAGTPAHGSFTLAMPGWMYNSNSPLYAGGGTSTYNTSYTIGSAVATATVTITPVGGSKSSFIMKSVGTLAKNRKAITMSLNDSGNGDVLFRDWREVSP